MKKFLAFILQGLGEDFEYRMRRMKTGDEFHALLDEHLDGDAAVPELPPERSKVSCGFSELIS